MRGKVATTKLVHYDMNQFKDCRVLVTAGASGIGLAIARGFAGAGARLHVVDIDPEALERCRSDWPHADALVASAADVAEEGAVDKVFAQQKAAFDGVDVLVNCAGIKGPTGPVESLSLGDWQRCIEVNLQATFLCCKFAVPMMKQQSRGNIINISSTAGWHGYPLRSPYAAAKWGVIGLTKSLAMELGPSGIRANAICPGSVTGVRMDKVIADEAKEKNLTEAEIREQYTNSVSLRSFIDPEDISDTAMFLASSQASKITGQSISVDGHLESVGGL